MVFIWSAAEACPPAAPDAPQGGRGPRRLFESMLSKIETNWPAFADDAAPAMQGPHTQHLRPPEQRQGRSVGDHAARSAQTIGHRNAAGSEGVSAEVLIPSAEDACLEGFLVVIEPGGNTNGILQHKGEEVGYVVEGQLELTINKEVRLLNSGDSFYFPRTCRTPIATRQTRLRVVWINTPADVLSWLGSTVAIYLRAPRFRLHGATVTSSAAPPSRQRVADRSHSGKDEADAGYPVLSQTIEIIRHRPVGTGDVRDCHEVCTARSL